ncbi:BglG family transcriptional antiterminator [Breznakia blatticola]|uniref:BglG family transcriptional antiterminator n=1 Tax=Breznakia blatticola TaxID=1754012 RepID=A0A4R7ZFH5_9FIRM|nr:PTS sugar transporter subunit IIA [Breznakia blatticola]TDW16403.1 BglG family transcriptional antiterminator [Breznakia blatticola]
MRSREIDVINLLLNEKKIYAYNELAVSYGISDRLVRYAIEDANVLLESIGASQIEKIRGKGVLLNVDEEEKKRILEYIYLKDDPYQNKSDREVIMFFNILDNSNKILAQDFQELFGVSKSAIDQSMKSIRGWCKEFGIDIVSNNKEGLSLTGSEGYIRLLVNNIINTQIDIQELINEDLERLSNDKFTSILNFLNQADLITIYHDLRKTFSEESLNNELYFLQLSIYFCVWKARYFNQNSIREDDRFIKKYRAEHTELIVDRFLSIFNINNVPGDERNYLDFMVDSLNIQRKQTLPREWVKIQMFMIELIESMSIKRSVAYERDTNLFENLVQHFAALLKRIDENIEIYNPLKNMVKQEYQSIYEDIQASLDELPVFKNRNISESEIAYLCIHFGASEEKLKSMQSEKYRVIIMCGHGLATGELLAQRVKRIYQFDVIGIVGSYEAQATRRMNADFILKTTNVEVDTLPSLQINPMLHQVDKEKIEAFIALNKQHFHSFPKKIEKHDVLEDIIECIFKDNERLNKTLLTEKIGNVLEKHEIHFKKKGYQPMISDVLKDEYIQLNVKAKDWQDVIVQVANPLLKDKVIEPCYVDAMIESVNKFGPYIVISEGVALAHARPEEGVNELGISLVTLDPPIAFNHEDHDPVKLVFCLAAIDDNAHLKMMATIVKLINEEKKIEELVSIKDKEEFKKVLFEFEKN